jgi:hypothetical protein
MSGVGSRSNPAPVDLAVPAVLDNSQPDKPVSLEPLRRVGARSAAHLRCVDAAPLLERRSPPRRRRRRRSGAQSARTNGAFVRRGRTDGAFVQPAAGPGAVAGQRARAMSKGCWSAADGAAGGSTRPAARPPSLVGPKRCSLTPNRRAAPTRLAKGTPAQPHWATAPFARPAQPARPVAPVEVHQHSARRRRRRQSRTRRRSRSPSSARSAAHSSGAGGAEPDRQVRGTAAPPRRATAPFARPGPADPPAGPGPNVSMPNPTAGSKVLS